MFNGTQISNDQKLGLMTTGAANHITRLMTKYPEWQAALGADVDLAKSLTDDVNSFLNTFQDNPVRRIISLIAGCVLGYTVALVLHLDMFAALGIATNGPFPQATWSAGVPLTGLIMGLGSNPTHEVIQAIQQYKQGQGSASSSSATAGS